MRKSWVFWRYIKEKQCPWIAELKARTGDVDFYPAFENTSSSLNVWSDGEISIGKNSASTISSSREFNRKVLTMGIDKEYTQDNLIGFALSVEEVADVGTDGSAIQSTILVRSSTQPIHQNNYHRLKRPLGMGT